MNMYPEKFAHTGTQSEPSVQARRKAAEERAANLVRIIDAAASPPETMTNADIARPTSKKPLKPNGDWHVWKNSPNGGLTGAIQAHMLKYHAYIYTEKCKAEGVLVKQLDCEDSVTTGFNLEEPQPAFTREGLLERLVRWIAVDDQSMNVVEQPEFRDILLYCGQGVLQNKDIPHQNKVTSEAHEAYQKAKTAIMHEIK
ncbi:hypothetical protein FRC11_003123, partial [Ceratobasidium sp. 423]